MRRVILVLIFAVVPILGNADTIHVPGDQPNIQAGIDAAVSGDTVLVADGTYTGSGNRDLTWSGKAISVRSENGPEQCIINCQYMGRAFYLNDESASASQISGFKITYGDPGYDVGGGIHCFGADMEITNCILTSNFASYGAGIYCKESNSEIRNCTINGNHASVSGGGIHSRSGNLTIINCAIFDNSADWGGGYNGSAGGPTIINCTFGFNSAPSGGGAIRCGGGSTVNNCILRGDYPQEIRVHSEGTLSVSYCDLEGGEEGIDGGTVTWGEGNIDADPLWVTGPDGEYYLSQVSAGQLEDSPCVNAGQPLTMMAGTSGFGHGTTLCRFQDAIGRRTAHVLYL